MGYPMGYLSLGANCNILQALVQIANFVSLPGDVVPLSIACLSQLLQHSIPILKPTYIAAAQEFVNCKAPVCRLHPFGPHL